MIDVLEAGRAIKSEVMARVCGARIFGARRISGTFGGNMVGEEGMRDDYIQGENVRGEGKPRPYILPHSFPDLLECDGPDHTAGR